MSVPREPNSTDVHSRSPAADRRVVFVACFRLVGAAVLAVGGYLRALGQRNRRPTPWSSRATMTGGVYDRPLNRLPRPHRLPRRASDRRRAGRAPSARSLAGHSLPPGHRQDRRERSRGTYGLDANQIPEFPRTDRKSRGTTSRPNPGPAATPSLRPRHLERPRRLLPPRRPRAGDQVTLSPTAARQGSPTPSASFSSIPATQMRHQSCHQHRTNHHHHLRWRSILRRRHRWLRLHPPPHRPASLTEVFAAEPAPASGG